jgi:hypothetical protein
MLFNILVRHEPFRNSRQTYFVDPRLRHKSRVSRASSRGAPRSSLGYAVRPNPRTGAAEGRIVQGNPVRMWMSLTQLIAPYLGARSLSGGLLNSTMRVEACNT